MDALLGLLNSPFMLTLIGVGWGLVCKYAPFLRNAPNALIPWITWLGVALVKLAAPHDAGAAMAAADTDTLIVNPLVAIGTPTVGLMQAGLAGAWQSVVCSLIYEVFLRHWLERVGLKKTEPLKAKVN